MSDVSVENFAGHLETERSWVLRRCARFTGDLDAAEDLAQEVLLVAWRNRHRLSRSEARSSWLAGITRNICLHWARDRGREARQLSAEIADLLAGDVDLAGRYERRETWELLARALGTLPPATGEALVQHYAVGRSQAEIAGALGVSPAVVEARLRRGRGVMRRVLTTELGAEALSLGVIPAPASGWIETRLWCADCGGARLLARLGPDRVAFRCTRCEHRGEGLKSAFSLENPSFAALLGGLRQPRRVLDRILTWSHDYFTGVPGRTERPCTGCGGAVVLRRFGPDGAAGIEQAGSRTDRGLWVRCDQCGEECTVSFGGILAALPAVRAFQEQHARVRPRALSWVDAAGRPALVGGYETLEGGSGITVVADAVTFEPLSIHGAAR